MSYTKEARGLSQNQAVENLRAVISSDHFKDYEFCPGGSRIALDILGVNSIGGLKEGTTESYRVEDLSNIVLSLLNAAENKGVLKEAFVQLTPSEKRLRAMALEEKVYEDDLQLPLTFCITKDQDSGTFSFRVQNFGFKESYFDSEGLDFKNAKQKLAIWYREVTRVLKNTLPYPVTNQTFS